MCLLVLRGRGWNESSLVTTDLVTSLICFFQGVLWSDVQWGTERWGKVLGYWFSVAAQIVHCCLMKYSGKERREAQGWCLKYQSCYKIQSETVEGGLTTNQLLILQVSWQSLEKPCQTEPWRNCHCYRLLRTIGELRWMARDFIPFEIKIPE